MTTVSFPALGINWEIDRVAFFLPGIHWPVYWYGLLITFGMVLAYLYITRREKRQGRNPEDIVDAALYAIPAAIIGARTYYVIFRWDTYREHPIDVFKIWEGGLAIYGGIIGALIAAGIYCRVRHKNFLRYGDAAAFGLLIGQSVGRWGNFVNGEAYGSRCLLPWRMCVNNEPYPVHPTFLYESLWNLITLLVMHRLEKKKLRPKGFFFFLYLITYGTGRMWIEALRSDSLYLTGTGIKASQAVAVASIVIGIVGLFCVGTETGKRKKTR